MVDMKVSAAVNYFGSKSEIARRLGITRQAVSKWGELVPRGWAFELTAISSGVLRPPALTRAK